MQTQDFVLKFGVFEILTFNKQPIPVSTSWRMAANINFRR